MEKGKGKGPGKGKGKGREKSRKGSRHPSPARSNHSRRGSGTDGYESKAALRKRYRPPAFCKDYLAEKCTRDIALRAHPKGRTRGAHSTAEAHAKLKEKSKADLETAKEKRNHSAGPGGKR